MFLIYRVLYMVLCIIQEKTESSGYWSKGRPFSRHKLLCVLGRKMASPVLTQISKEYFSLNSSCLCSHRRLRPMIKTSSWLLVTNHHMKQMKMIFYFYLSFILNIDAGTQSILISQIQGCLLPQSPLKRPVTLKCTLSPIFYRDFITI